MISRLVLIVNAIAIGVIGLFYTFDPNLLLARYGLAVDAPGLDSMLRATYGGLYLFCAGIFALGVFRAARRKDALAFLAIFMAGSALGRIASIASVGMPPASILPLLFYELAFAIIAGFLFVRQAPAAR